MTLPLFTLEDTVARAQTLRNSFEAYVAARARAPSIRRAARALSFDSAEMYRQIWRAFTLYCAERSLELQNIDSADLENFLRSRGEHDDVSPRYASRVLSLINKVIRFEAQGLGTSPNTAAEVLLRSEPYRYANARHREPLPDFLTAAESRRLIAHVTGIHHGAKAPYPVAWTEVRNGTAVAVQLGAGLAPGDVRVLRVANVIFEGGRRAGLPWKLDLVGNGNSPARQTPIAEWAARQLAHWLRLRAEQAIAGELVFPSTKSGKSWSKPSSYLAFRQVLERAGIADPAGGSYKLRHSFALRQLKRGKSDEEVAAWLGVQDVAVIARYRRVLERPIEVV